ncbi:MAG: sialate O-acetylesterase, partial [Verrucomicrobiota bacterium]|nr:sialate O-acetylesterase [Verrucomicrobiota bacterium]
HGDNYAAAYLRSLGQAQAPARSLKRWPYKKGSEVNLFILAGHRNMEGERAFVQNAAKLGQADLLKDNPGIAFKYSLGGGYRKSDGWEPLGQVVYYDTFGPELSFAGALQDKRLGNVAIAKFTHSGSQIIDWTPEGSMARSRHIYPEFVKFIQQSIRELEAKGHKVRLTGIVYHLGENDMSFYPYRKEAAGRLQTIIGQSRKDLGQPELKWFVSQQPPTDEKGVNRIDVVADMEKVAAADPNLIHIKAFNLPPQKKRLVLDTAGVIALGRLLGERIAAGD